MSQPYELLIEGSAPLYNSRLCFKRYCIYLDYSSPEYNNVRSTIVRSQSLLFLSTLSLSSLLLLLLFMFANHFCQRAKEPPVSSNTVVSASGENCDNRWSSSRRIAAVTSPPITRLLTEKSLLTLPVRRD